MEKMECSSINVSENFLVHNGNKLSYRFQLVRQK